MAMPQGLNARDSKAREAANVKTFLARKEELWQQKSAEEFERRQICDYIMPRRDFALGIDSEKGTRKRRLVDSTAMIVHERASATIFGYLLDPTTPWIRPQLLERDMTYAEDSWADETARRMHGYMSGAESNFRSQFAEDVEDAVGFGDSVLWQQPTRRGAVWLSVPNKQMAWSEDELGRFHEHYRIYPMTLRRAAERWPNSVKLREAAARATNPAAVTIEILHIVEPRPGGVKGDLREVKPWKDIQIYIDGSEVLEIGGHDRAGFNVGRLRRQSGQVYGRGIGWTLLPLAKLANAILESVVRNAELLTDPPLMSLMPKGQPLDRRPGAVNHINTLLAAGFRDPKDILQRVNVGGDIGVGFEMLRMIWGKMDQAGYIDWMTPREGPVETATGVWDKRDMRMKSLAPIVAKVETEKMTALAENTFEDLMAAGRLPPPPASLDKELMGFAHLTPLSNAQRQAQMEGFQRYVAFATQIVQATGSPEAGRMLKAEQTLRAAANNWNVDSRFLASPEEMDAFREGQRELGDMQQEMAATEAAARALQAGGQGISNLAKVVQPGGAA